MSRTLIGYVLLAVLLPGCDTSAPPAKPADGSEDRAPRSTNGLAAPQLTAQSNADNLGALVELKAIALTAPQEWVRKKPSSDFVLAEFTLPRGEGDDWDGRLTTSVAGGDIEANVERWRTQFGGKPANESRRQTVVDGLDVTLIDFSGDYSDQRGPLSPATNRPGARMLAAIISVGQELYFIKAIGPEKTMAVNEERFENFIHSLKKR